MLTGHASFLPPRTETEWETPGWAPGAAGDDCERISVDVDGDSPYMHIVSWNCHGVANYSEGSGDEHCAGKFPVLFDYVYTVAYNGVVRCAYEGYLGEAEESFFTKQDAESELALRLMNE